MPISAFVIPLFLYLFLHAQSLAGGGRGAEVQSTNQPAKIGTEMVTIHLENVSRDEANAVLAIQGIVNRAGPRIFVFLGEKNTWGKFTGQESGGTSRLPAEFLAKYPNTDNLFEEYYIQKRGFRKREVQSLKDLYLEFQSDLKGAVLYDVSKVDQCMIAFSFASAEDYLPVTAKLLAD
jgi:hypothetical protein